MKKYKILFLLIATLIFIIFICFQAIKDKKQRIEVKMLVTNDKTYETINMITNQIDVRKIKKIINNAIWKTATDEMSRPADYIFYFQYENKDYERKAILYQICINSNNKQIKLFRGTNEFSVLTLNQSISLIELLIQ